MTQFGSVEFATSTYAPPAHSHSTSPFFSPTVPRTEILGEPDRYVKAGSNVVLRCIVRGALEPPTFIMWYHGAEQLAADSRRHRTQLDPNLPEASGEGQSTVSTLSGTGDYFALSMPGTEAFHNSVSSKCGTRFLNSLAFNNILKILVPCRLFICKLFY